jgi:hypothetical protein
MKNNYYLPKNNFKFETEADDYEHTGDTDCKLDSLKKHGFRATVDSWDTDEEEAEIIIASLEVSESKIEDIIDRCKSVNERAERTGDYSLTMSGDEILWILSLYDKKFNSDYVKRFKSELENL